MAMDQFLAELYGTNKTASAQPAAPAVQQHTDEDLAKQASIDLFIKTAADENIDLKSMPADAVNALYGQFVEKLAEANTAGASKTAGEMPPQFAKKDGDDKGKKDDDGDKGGKSNPFEAAKKEHEEKKAAAEKLAEADFLGRVIAHSMVQELGKIAEARETQEKAANAQPPQTGAAAQVQSKVASSESNFDLVAGNHAISMAKEAGFDVEQATRKVAAVLELGLQDSTKTASAPFEQAVGIRALEILEAAGYPVTWNDK